jgi:hypothetical protein
MDDKCHSVREIDQYVLPPPPYILDRGVTKYGFKTVRRHMRCQFFAVEAGGYDSSPLEKIVQGKRNDFDFREFRHNRLNTKIFAAGQGMPLDSRSLEAFDHRI